MLQQILKQYWNYNAFRPLQEDIITTVIEGKDCFAMLPTGGGKSVCYQVPALAKDGFCLVISPLIALMQDQVMQLRKRGIEASFIHSGMTSKQLDEVLYQASKGTYKLLYISPERLQSELFQDYLSQFNLNLIAIDEAHCISQWGHDFRPAYRQISIIRKSFPDVPVMALTASANQKVQEDIIEQLKLKQPNIFKQSVVRENLFYQVYYSENKPGDITRTFRQNPGSGILYCRSRKRCVDTALQLKNDGLDTGIYHAGLAKEEREFAQVKWTQSNKAVICATTAFGMGIDKPDVRQVIHYDLPDNLEEYYQEAGRAGRDGDTAFATLFFNHRDIVKLEASTDIKYPSADYLAMIYHLVGDYLKMPVGNGSEQLQAFDAIAFIQAFQLEMLKTLSAVKLLDREGFWVWNENVGTETIVEFTTDRNTLNHLEKSHPKLSYIATGLLRIYGSVFHFPTAIRPFDVSKMLRIEKPQLDEGLRQLAALGIIQYQPATSGGTLYWLHDRIGKPLFRLNMTRIETLKKAYQERVSKMIAFIGNETVCRNILLSQYFGESTKAECGRCDACLRKQDSKKLPHNFRSNLLTLIKSSKEISIARVQQNFPEMPIDTIIFQVRLLNDEGLCRINAAGIIFAD